MKAIDYQRINKKGNKLDKNQIEILKKFILYFLPKRGNKRKNPKNEIEYITETLDKLFNKHFDFRLSRQNIQDAFEALGYEIMYKNSIWDSDEKKYKPSVKGDNIRIGDGYTDNNCAFTYIDIDSPIIKQLALSIYKSEETKMNADKIEILIAMNEKMRLFKQTVNHLL